MRAVWTHLSSGVSEGNGIIGQVTAAPPVLGWHEHLPEIEGARERLDLARDWLRDRILDLSGFRTRPLALTWVSTRPARTR